MSDLRARLDDLLGGTPAYVAVPDAAAAWRAGARRRTRRRVASGAAVLVLVVLAGLGAGLLPRVGTVQPTDREGGVDGYPTRIGDPWRLRDVPAAPGPMAGVLELSGEDRVIAPNGGTWRVPHGPDLIDDYPSALSRDGRMLGYLASGGVYVVHDLTTGERRTFAGITDNRPDRAETGTWWPSPQSPSSWSPDGSAVLVRAERWDAPDRVGALLFGADGTVTEVSDHRFPVGWISDDRLAWLDERRRDDRTVLVVTTTDGAVVREVVVPRMRNLDQWTGSVSPDGRLLSLRTGGQVLLVSTASGEIVQRHRVSADDDCLPSWRAGDVVLPHAGTEHVLIDPDGTIRTSVDPDLETYCLTMAGDALAGEAHTPPDRHGLEVGLVLLSAVIAGGLSVLRRRRRLSASAAPGSA